MKHLIKVTLLLLFVPFLLLQSCQQGKGENAEASHEEHGHEEEEIALNEAQMKAVGIKLGTVSMKNLHTVVKANGQLAVPPQNRANVSVLSGGIISNISVLEGEQVRKGQVLASIENQDLLKIQQDYLSAKNSFSYTSAEYERQKQLRQAGAGTGKFFQSAEAAYLSEKSGIAAIENQLRQLGISPGEVSAGKMKHGFPLRSPISGTIGKITANTGSFIQPGTSVMEVVDNSKIHCDLIVFEKDLMKVKNGQEVNFQLTNQDDQQVTGRITGINKSFEDESKGVTVHAVIDNQAGKNLIPGMYVTALINIGQEHTTAVPQDAVVRSAGREYIFVVDNHQKEDQGKRETKAGSKEVHFRKLEVKTGTAELGFIQISPLETLSEDARIATKGAFYLLSKITGGSDSH
ncbi:efflux RND transporter periplasmic adaptor subunit [Pedobacter antarcticus]|uniref:efflux RND transporter periplasmic adaptor subunit n=1 Tax=Pedobacter antarcticus TaxID=34086 RepID=UPI000887FFEE|nr:efflux RND transporter periplasmic adaptor subunit [Pedobacter antarcticus]SDM00545.1 membrane fusion protein, cobalt-zinc-cadmium efflux system [Pedobacter antarcticus]